MLGMYVGCELEEDGVYATTERCKRIIVCGGPGRYGVKE